MASKLVALHKTRILDALKEVEGGAEARTIDADEVGEWLKLTRKAIKLAKWGADKGVESIEVASRLCGGFVPNSYKFQAKSSWVTLVWKGPADSYKVWVRRGGGPNRPSGTGDECRVLVAKTGATLSERVALKLERGRNYRKFTA